MSVPVSMQHRGPVPTCGGPVTMVAQEDMDENTVVTFGTEDQTIVKCDASDFPLGWIQASVEEDETTDVWLYGPMWLVKLASTSDDVSFGDTLECADDGEVQRLESGTSAITFGKALQDGSAGENILALPVVSVPTYTSS